MPIHTTFRKNTKNCSWVNL